LASHGGGHFAQDQQELPNCESRCLTAVILRQAHAAWRGARLGEGISLAKAALMACCDRCNEPCSIYAGLLLVLFLSSIRSLDRTHEVLNQLTAADPVHVDPKLMACTTLVRAKVALADGDLAGAETLAEAGLQRATDVGLTAWTPLGHLVLATTALRRGDLAVAIRYANHLEEDAVFGREMFPIGQSAWLIVQITEAEKGREKAATLARELLESESFTRWLLASEPAAVPWLVRLMLDLDQRDAAQQGVRFSRKAAAENPDIHSIHAATLHAAGLLDEDLGMLRGAAQSHLDSWARASAIEDVGIRLAEGSRECPEAAENFELALRSYAQMGSLRDSSRVRSRLRRINASPSSQDRLRPRSGIPCLTDTEYAVASLVSRGLTNGQAAQQMFLSRHTVAFHLRKIFQKIGVKSRLELAVLWKDLDGGDGAGAWDDGNLSRRESHRPRTLRSAV
jgi:ATP/maltotriose-dependent transcriptional regulator MalT